MNSTILDGLTLRDDGDNGLLQRPPLGDRSRGEVGDTVIDDDDLFFTFANDLHADAMSVSIASVCACKAHRLQIRGEVREGAARWTVVLFVSFFVLRRCGTAKRQTLDLGRASRPNEKLTNVFPVLHHCFVVRALHDYLWLLVRFRQVLVTPGGSLTS